jgi:hypothetical protein
MLLDVMMLGMDGFVVCQLLKLARNSGSNTPPPFIDDLLDVSDRSMMPMVVEKEPWIEPHTGEDKDACARQAFGGADFEVTGLDEALEEQLDGFTAIGVEVSLPQRMEQKESQSRNANVPT